MDFMRLGYKLGITDVLATMGIKYLSIQAPRKAQAKLKQVYEQINSDFVNAAPFTLHASVPDLVAAVWSVERETVFHGIVPRGHKEAVVASVAIINECPYCTDAHTVMMTASDEKEAAQILLQNSGAVMDEKLQKLITWAKATRTPDADILRNPPFSAKEAPEIIGSALAFHYINRMVDTFVDGKMIPNLGFFGGLARAIMSSTMFNPMMKRPITAGASLKFLPSADLPQEFIWARGNDVIKKTFAGVTASITHHIQDLASEQTLITVQAVFDGWQGENMGMSRAWVNEATQALDGGERIMAKLMLLAGLAPYQVSESDIVEFRDYYPDDAQLVAITSWGAWSAVRRISSWLHVEN